MARLYFLSPLKNPYAHPAVIMPVAMIPPTDPVISAPRKLMKMKDPIAPVKAICGTPRYLLICFWKNGMILGLALAAL